MSHDPDTCADPLRNLNPLSLVGCALPGRAGPAAQFIRKATFQQLWPLMAENSEQRAALLAVVNAHEQALWWITNQNRATTLITAMVARWIALKNQLQTK